MTSAAEHVAALAERLRTRRHSQGDIAHAARLLEQLATIVAAAERPVCLDEWLAMHRRLRELRDDRNRYDDVPSDSEPSE